MGVKKKDSRPGSGMGGILIPMGKSTFLLGHFKKKQLTVIDFLFEAMKIFITIHP